MISFLQRNSLVSIGEMLGTDINTGLFYNRKGHTQLLENVTLELKNSGYAQVISVAPSAQVHEKLPTGKDLEVRLVRLYLIDTELDEVLQHKKVDTFGKNYILISTDINILSSQLEDAVYLLQMKGYSPVLVQAERYIHLQDNYRNVTRLMDRGCLLQMEMLSLTGYHGAAPRRLANKLLKEHWVSFVGSGISDENSGHKFKSLLRSKSLIKHLQAHNIRNRELNLI